MSKYVALFKDIRLARPDIDELRDFRSLVVRLRDQNDKGINIEFDRYLQFCSADESYSMHLVTPILDQLTDRRMLHWLYEVEESELVRQFRDKNPQIPQSRALRQFLIITLSDVISVIAYEEPRITERTDDIRGWTR